ncbi:hypothetical protein [Pseudanabaena sp. PCC 6802]|uniref:hypothetical protein n=1 Tax=Pseudanabaena sp. PCC 6802 TaxID=118173 RepID=UPI0003487DD4|nr:hypothetical protein [Pseudanabaena sp. PCC 6802]
MFTSEQLAREFIAVVEDFYPQIGVLLQRCCVRAINAYSKTSRKHFRYIGIYCPEDLMAAVQLHKYPLREIAENMGLVEVVCINATRLLRDPMSNLKYTDPRFWLELHLLLRN